MSLMPHPVYSPAFAAAPFDGGGGDGRALSLVGVGDGPEEDNRLVFLASLPLTGSPVRMLGDGSMRVTVEVSEQQKANAVALMALTGRLLRVTIDVVTAVEVEAGEGNESESEGRYGGRSVRRSAAKRRVGAGGAGV